MDTPDFSFDTSNLPASILANEVQNIMDQKAMRAAEQLSMEIEHHGAVMSIAENAEKTAQDVRELTDTVSGIDNRIALLNRRVEELKQDLETEKQRADVAEKILAKKEHGFQIWLVILSCLLAPEVLKFIFQIIQAVIARLQS